MRDAPEGYQAWVAGSRTRLLRSAYLLTGDLAHAEDLVQEACIKVADRWGRLATGNPTAYARTIIARDHASWWRRRRETPSGAAVPERSAPEVDTEVRSVLMAALAELAPRQRAVVVLRYFDDLTEAETAEVLNIARGTVKSQNHAALRRLRTSAGVRELAGLDDPARPTALDEEETSR